VCERNSFDLQFTCTVILSISVSCYISLLQERLITRVNVAKGVNVDATGRTDAVGIGMALCLVQSHTEFTVKLLAMSVSQSFSRGVHFS